MLINLIPDVPDRVTKMQALDTFEETVYRHVPYVVNALCRPQTVIEGIASGTRTF